MSGQILGPRPDALHTPNPEIGPMGLPIPEFEKLVESVCIMIPHRQDTPPNPQLCETYGMWARWGATIWRRPDNFGGFIEVTRAAMAREFLDLRRKNPNLDKVVFIDADENVNPEAPFRLAFWDKPVVSGVVCNYSDTRGVFACFTVKDQNGIARFPSYNFTKVLPGKGLIEAHSVGTGLVCIKACVFEKMFDNGILPFYIPEDERRRAAESGMLKWGEDISFSRQCEELGFDRYVDLSVHAVHYKVMPVTWPRNALDYEIDPKTWQVNPKDYRHG